MTSLFVMLVILMFVVAAILNEFKCCVKAIYGELVYREEQDLVPVDPSAADGGWNHGGSRLADTRIVRKD